MRRILFISAAAALVLAAAGCGGDGAEPAAAAVPADAASIVELRDTVIAAVLEAAGTAEPFAQATLSTKLMGAVTRVAVREGDHVAAGAVLVQVDARDIEARRAQVAAQLAEAQAVQRDARTNVERLRRLHAESVATRAQLDAAETGLARAEAAVRLAQAAAAEVEAIGGYAEVRAPFAGVVTQRFADVGDFAAPGTPLVTVEDAARLRIAAHAAPEAVRGLRRGQVIEALIEGRPARAVIEGVVPAPAGMTYTVNAVVENPARAFLPHSAAALLLPQGTQRAVVVPLAAVTREGDLAGVRLRTAQGVATRWVRLGRTIGDGVEVLAGLAAGDRIVLPAGAPAKAD